MGVRFPHALLIMKEYDIGELVLHVDKFDQKIIFGLITDKCEADGIIRYEIHWSDNLHDNAYNSREVESYIQNAKQFHKRKMR